MVSNPLAVQDWLQTLNGFVEDVSLVLGAPNTTQH